MRAFRFSPVRLSIRTSQFSCTRMTFDVSLALGPVSFIYSLLLAISIPLFYLFSIWSVFVLYSLRFHIFISINIPFVCVIYSLFVSNMFLFSISFLVSDTTTPHSPCSNASGPWSFGLYQGYLGEKKLPPEMKWENESPRREYHHFSFGEMAQWTARIVCTKAPNNSLAGPKLWVAHSVDTKSILS